MRRTVLAGGQRLEHRQAAAPRPHVELGRVQGLALRRVEFRLGHRLAAAAMLRMERGRDQTLGPQSTQTQVGSSLRRHRMIACGGMVARRAGWERMRSSRCCPHKVCGLAMRGRSSTRTSTAMLCWLGKASTVSDCRCLKRIALLLRRQCQQSQPDFHCLACWL